MGKKNGNGKEYYDNGNIEFEGIYSNGKRKGKGREYYYINKLKYEGEYLNGESMEMGKSIMKMEY